VTKPKFWNYSTYRTEATPCWTERRLLKCSFEIVRVIKLFYSKLSHFWFYFFLFGACQGVFPRCRGSFQHRTWDHTTSSRSCTSYSSRVRRSGTTSGRRRTRSWNQAQSSSRATTDDPNGPLKSAPPRNLSIPLFCQHGHFWSI